VIAIGALVAGAACNTPREAAQSDSAAGGSPMSKLDSTSTPATIDGKTTDTPADTSAQGRRADSAGRRPGGTP